MFRADATFDGEQYDQVQRESSKLAVEVSNGIVIEALKSAMFAQQPQALQAEEQKAQ